MHINTIMYRVEVVNWKRMSDANISAKSFSTLYNKEISISKYRLLDKGIRIIKYQNANI